MNDDWHVLEQTNPSATTLRTSTRSCSRTSRGASASTTIDLNLVPSSSNRTPHMGRVPLLLRLFVGPRALTTSRTTPSMPLQLARIVEFYVQVDLYVLTLIL